jgi:hypothetical protein
MPTRRAGDLRHPEADRERVGVNQPKNVTKDILEAIDLYIICFE